MLLRDFLKTGSEALERLYPAPEARALVQMLCQELAGTRSYTHITEPEFALDGRQEQVLGAALQRLSAGEPVQYVLGCADFCDFRFRVAPGVLIPRPETEWLVREAVKMRPARVLDLCTGSGCIAWSVALSLPGTEVVGVDISDAALSLARSQPFGPLVRERGARPPVFVKADILAPEEDFPYREFDLVISNPPYVMEREKAFMRPNVLEHEPPEALFVQDEDPLLFYGAIARWARRFLVPGGGLLVEINESLGAETAALFEKNGFSGAACIEDFRGKNRYVRALK